MIDNRVWVALVIENTRDGILHGNLHVPILVIANLLSGFNCTYY